MLEARQLTVLSQKATQRIPTHLPSGCTAVCCQIQTASKAQAQVVLGGPHAGMHDVWGEGLKGQAGFLFRGGVGGGEGGGTAGERSLQGYGNCLLAKPRLE